ncbi:FMN-dependent NADH-azoreductase [Methyloceanibacter sp.]|uniref:FMN-dependent NADH-azoreductase n=1 Tax=Methyloceanibacter sp. TaxID=1965321 RepID=UPI002D69EF4B|nr:NAD(P)H-dependent oxidoreductase [Methyloceanibacter sp.]HZP08700.1 NAD(P)H-dependent oxidoreductase [Methyloceanibacter sp.]
MTTLLHIDASARKTRSISRGLSRLFVETWLKSRPRDRVIRRDLAEDPPPHVTEAWIAACFTPQDQRDEQARAALAWSDRAIAELAAANLIVIGTPMYNYGMPSALKAWFDQVIRIGSTFSFDLARGDWPIEPILSGKRLVVLSSRGEFGFAPGGVRQHMNQLDPHLVTCARYLGVGDDAVHIISIEYQEFGGERHSRSLAAAQHAASELAAKLTSSIAPLAEVS